MDKRDALIPRETGRVKKSEVVPEDYLPISECVMSNCDHQIDRKIEALLKENHYYAGYSAWNFYGYVWYTGDKFKCVIAQYHNHVATLEANTLEEIMEEASSRWGYD